MWVRCRGLRARSTTEPTLPAAFDDVTKQVRLRAVALQVRITLTAVVIQVEGFVEIAIPDQDLDRFARGFGRLDCSRQDAAVKLMAVDSDDSGSWRHSRAVGGAAR